MYIYNLVPAQANVALLVDKLVFRGQTLESIVGHPAAVTEMFSRLLSLLLNLVHLTSCQHSKVLLGDSFSSWLQKLNIGARRMSQSRLAARCNLGSGIRFSSEIFIIYPGARWEVVNLYNIIKYRYCTRMESI